MFSFLFKGSNDGNLNCDACEPAKRKGAIFPPSNGKSVFPFTLITEIFGVLQIFLTFLKLDGLSNL